MTPSFESLTKNVNTNTLEEKNINIRRNCIIWANLGTNKGHIQSGCRPCIVVSCDKANKYAPVYTVIPGTTQYNKENFPVHCKIKPDEVEGFLKKKTIFLAEQICTIDENQVVSLIGEIKSKKVIKQVNRIIIKQLELDNEVSEG